MLFQRFPFFNAKEDIDQFRNIVQMFGKDSVARMARKYGLKMTREQREVFEEEDPSNKR